MNTLLLFLTTGAGVIIALVMIALFLKRFASGTQERLERLENTLRKLYGEQATAEDVTRIVNELLKRIVEINSKQEFSCPAVDSGLQAKLVKLSRDLNSMEELEESKREAVALKGRISELERKVETLSGELFQAGNTQIELTSERIRNMELSGKIEEMKQTVDEAEHNLLKLRSGEAANQALLRQKATLETKLKELPELMRKNAELTRTVENYAGFKDRMDKIFPPGTLPYAIFSIPGIGACPEILKQTVKEFFDAESPETMKENLLKHLEEVSPDNRILTEQVAEIIKKFA